MIVKDCLFHDDRDKKYITIGKGSVFNDVPYREQSREIRDCLANCSKLSKNLNVNFIVLDCQGAHRVLEVGRSAIRSQQKRIRRIKRHETNTGQRNY